MLSIQDVLVVSTRAANASSSGSWYVYVVVIFVHEIVITACCRSEFGLSNVGSQF